MHGAEIYAGFLEDTNMETVHGIEADGLARKFFTFQFAEQAIRKMFPNEGEQLLDSLWPFFAHRIPGLGQPGVKKLWRKKIWTGIMKPTS